MRRLHNVLRMRQDALSQSLLAAAHPARSACNAVRLSFTWSLKRCASLPKRAVTSVCILWPSSTLHMAALHGHLLLCSAKAGKEHAASLGQLQVSKTQPLLHR